MTVTLEAKGIYWNIVMQFTSVGRVEEAPLRVEKGGCPKDLGSQN